MIEQSFPTGLQAIKELVGSFTLIKSFYSGTLKRINQWLQDDGNDIIILWGKAQRNLI